MSIFGFQFSKDFISYSIPSCFSLSTSEKFLIHCLDFAFDNVSKDPYFSIKCVTSCFKMYLRNCFLFLGYSLFHSVFIIGII